MDYNFIPVNLHKNQQYTDKVIELFVRYKDTWIDDHWIKGNYIVDFINEVFSSQWFFAVVNEDMEFMGFVYLARWEGRNNKYHSVQIQGMMEKKYWGKDTEKVFSCLLRNLFETTNIERVQMEIDILNREACSLANRMGFQKEGILKNVAIKNGKPVHRNMYAITRGDYYGKE